MALSLSLKLFAIGLHLLVLSKFNQVDHYSNANRQVVMTGDFWVVRFEG